MWASSPPVLHKCLGWMWILQAWKRGMQVWCRPIRRYRRSGVRFLILAKGSSLCLGSPFLRAVSVGLGYVLDVVQGIVSFLQENEGTAAFLSHVVGAISLVAGGVVAGKAIAAIGGLTASVLWG